MLRCNYAPSLFRQCSSETAHQIITEECNHQMQCTLTASDDIFGNPCFGQYEYIDVTYSCVDQDNESGLNVSIRSDIIPLHCNENLHGYLVGRV